MAVRLEKLKALNILLSNMDLSGFKAIVREGRSPNEKDDFYIKEGEEKKERYIDGRWIAWCFIIIYCEVTIKIDTELILFNVIDSI